MILHPVRAGHTNLPFSMFRHGFAWLRLPVRVGRPREPSVERNPSRTTTTEIDGNLDSSQVCTKKQLTDIPFNLRKRKTDESRYLTS